MPDKPRHRHSRTKTGCVTCRARKKKCDEVRPRCAGCRRNMLTCEWPPVAHGGHEPCRVSTELVPTSLGLCAERQALVIIPSPLPTIQAESGRACALTIHSVNLLQHYLSETIALFSVSPLESNPFATILLPLAYVDDLLMHGLLAFSGAHLSFKESSSIEVANATTLHYGRLLNGLRSEIASLKDGDLGKKERILRILMIACHYEVLSGDTRGAIFRHLHASHSLIESLLALGDGYQHQSPFNKGGLGFSIELYIFLSLTNNVTPYGAVKDRTLPGDDIIISRAAAELSSASGSFLAGRDGIYSLVTQVSLLASQRLDEELSGRACPSPVIRKTHDRLLDLIKCWEMPSSCTESESATVMLEHTRLAGKAFQEGLYIYLATAIAGTIVSDPAVMVVIQDHVDTLFSYGPRLLRSPCIAVILWPFIIAGTCITKQDQQETFLDVVRSKKFSMRHLFVLGDMMRLLWNDADPRMYGPYGLHLVIEKYKINPGFA